MRFLKANTLLCSILIASGMLFLLPPRSYGQEVPVKIEQPDRPKKPKRIQPRRSKAPRQYSNRKQLRNLRFKTGSRKKSDRAYRGDITGRKFRKDQTKRQTYARPQPNPYGDRKMQPSRAEKAGPRPEPTFRPQPKGEKARRGDITGRRRIRTLSKSSERARGYPQASPYGNRKMVPGDRPARVRSSMVARRSLSQPAERKAVTSVPPPLETTPRRIRKSRNPYAGKGPRRGETSTNKDIAGRNIRTKGTDSKLRPPAGGYRTPDVYYGRDRRAGEGGRFSVGAMRSGGFVSQSRASESAARAKPGGEFRNFQSPRSKGGAQPSFDPYAGRRKIGEGQRFRETRAQPVRTASRKSEAAAKYPTLPPSNISARRKIHKPKNPYAGKGPRRAEESSNQDIAGRRLRTLNFQSPRPSYPAALARPDTYYGRKDQRERAAELPVAGRGLRAQDFETSKFQGRFQPGELSPGFSAQGLARYKGDIRSSKPLKGGGSVSGRIWNNKETPIAVKVPGASQFNASRFQGRFNIYDLKPGIQDDLAVVRYQGNLRATKPLKGGGSISGKLWNNGEVPVAVRVPGASQFDASRFQGRFNIYDLKPGIQDDLAVVRYQGNMRATKPLKGGGSISGKLWNNGEVPIAVRVPGASQFDASRFQGRFNIYDLKPGIQDDLAVVRYQGNMRATKPLKGGGSISGRLWNNGEVPIAVRVPGSSQFDASGFQGRFNIYDLKPGIQDDLAVVRYQGNMRATKPLKGGGSISGKLWNNKDTPITVKVPGMQQQAASRFQGRFNIYDLKPGIQDDIAVVRYQGSMRASRPLKGAGGSISGGLFNNKENPIAVRSPGSGSIRAAKFQGGFKASKPLKGAGGSASGDLFNNNESPIAVKSPGAGSIRGAKFQGGFKASKPLKGAGGTASGDLARWNNDDTPITARVPGITNARAANFQGRYRKTDLSPGKYDDKAALRTSGTIKITLIDKAKNLFRDPDGSPRGTEGTDYGRMKSVFFYQPAKAKDYGGFVVTNSFSFKKNKTDFHPTYRYTQGDARNAKEEKEKTFKFRIWIAKLFGKDIQPSNLKGQDQKPRYDKRESDLWYK